MYRPSTSMHHLLVSTPPRICHRAPPVMPIAPRPRPPRQARTALLEADTARGREQQQQTLVAQLQQRASQAAAAAAKAARAKVGGAELSACLFATFCVLLKG